VEQRSIYTPSAEANRHGALPSHNRDEALIHVCAECMWFDRALKLVVPVYILGDLRRCHEHIRSVRDKYLGDEGEHAKNIARGDFTHKEEGSERGGHTTCVPHLNIETLCSAAELTVVKREAGAHGGCERKMRRQQNMGRETRMVGLEANT
jgi:hypothetical protein